MSNADFYRSTVFLPKTGFAMRAGLPQKEPEILAFWDQMDLYGAMRKASAGKPKYILHDGPPYANGNIHIGHAVNKILKDVVVKSWAALGYDAPYIPGWDCHGLPIEWKIEEQYRAKGQDKDKVDVLTFRDECRKFAQHWVDVQASEFQRLGVTGDWKNPYLTMTLKAEAQIAREIHKFAKNGGLYQGAKPVLWSVVEKTALAEAEVEYHDITSTQIDIAFEITRAPNMPELVGTYAVIWTTTPWTLPVNRALAYATDVTYTIATDGTHQFIVADALFDALAARVAAFHKDAMTLTRTGKTFTGDKLAGVVCAHPWKGLSPFFDEPRPMMHADFVTTDQGTGLVHEAPDHGEDDFFLCQKNGVDPVFVVQPDGTYKEGWPIVGGNHVYKVNAKDGPVCTAMAERGALLSAGNFQHSYPHSWRSKAKLIFRCTPQWFISMAKNDLRKTALKAISETGWYPAAGENRIRAMIEQRPDWCISRQRSWGVPIAIFVNKNTNEILQDDAVFNRIGEIFETEGSDAWFKRPAQDFLGNTYKANDYIQVFDIVDVWFESGATHAFVLEDRAAQHSPADLYLEGSDQHRGWFHSSLLESCGTRGRAPYKNVLTHGFVLDEKGYKMSKSLGNVVAPQDIMKTLGADILRLWTVTSDYSDDIRIGKNLLDTVSDMYRRIRNTLRYLLGALDGFTTGEKITEVDYARLPELDRLMLHEIAVLDAEIRAAVQRYDFMDIAQRIHHFCAVTLSAFYFDIRKDRLYCDRPDLFERRGYRTVLLHLFDCLTAWLAPILAFTAEEAWQTRPAGLFSEQSVHLRTYPAIPATWRDDVLAQKWETVRAVRKVVNGALEVKRADKTIGASLEAHPHIYVSKAIAAVLADTNLAEVCITSQASLHTGAAPAGAFTQADVADIGVVFTKAEGRKCERSWRILPEVGSDTDYPDLSVRDADAVRFFVSAQKAAE